MRIAVLSAALALAALWGCGGCGEGPRSGPPKVFEAPVALDEARVDAPAPMVWLSVAQSTAIEVGAGWPWVIEGMLQHPAALGDAWTDDFRIVGGDGTAESALELVLTDAAGTPVEAGFERLGAPLTAPLTLGPQDEAWPSWRLSPQASAKLPVGDYRLELRLTTSTFQARSPEVNVRVIAASDDPHAAALATADDAWARGAAADARLALEGILAQDPTEDRALTRKGMILEHTGDVPAALAAYRAALAAALARQPEAPEGGARHLFEAIERLEHGEAGATP